MSATLRALHEEHSRIALTLSAPGVEAKKFPQYLAAVLATLSALAAGSALAWTSPALPLLLSPDSHIPIDNDQGSWIGSLINLGAFLGALPAGLATDALGRKRTLLLLSIPLTTSWLLISFATSVWTIYAGRFVGGMAIGAISVASPMYIAELSESSVRGSLGTFFQLQITLGILFSYLVGLVNDYHVISYISCTIPVVFLVTFFYMPESPMYLLSVNRKDEATRALQWFRGQEYDVEDEMTRMRDTMNEARENNATLRDLVGTRGTVKAMIIMLGLMWFQQMCGINAVVFYTGQIFELSGSSLSPSYAAIVVGTVMVLATYASTLLVDRAGRRVLLLTSSAVMALCLSVLGVYFYLLLDLTYLSWLPLVTVAVYIVVFSIGFGPIPWMMLGELFPANIKGLASALIASVNWLLAFAVTKVFQNMVDLIGIGGTFWCFGAMCVLGTVFVAVLVPETKGKDLEEIQDELCGRKREREYTINGGLAERVKC